MYLRSVISSWLWTKRPNSDGLGGKNKVSEDDLADRLHISTMASD